MRMVRPVEDDRTVLYANFHGADPNEECVEIAVASVLFLPQTPSRELHHGQRVRTVSGRHAMGAAHSHQVGAIGPNWATGWIIERNLVHDVKCSGISLGTSEETGDNEWYRTERKTGHQYQLEAVFKGLRIGWKKGFVGSHIVRDNVIHDCGQNAIVGHMGGAFSTIEHNHIYALVPGASSSAGRWPASSFTRRSTPASWTTACMTVHWGCGLTGRPKGCVSAATCSTTMSAIWRSRSRMVRV